MCERTKARPDLTGTTYTFISCAVHACRRLTRHNSAFAQTAPRNRTRCCSSHDPDMLADLNSDIVPRGVSAGDFVTIDPVTSAPRRQPRSIATDPAIALALQLGITPPLIPGISTSISALTNALATSSRSNISRSRLGAAHADPLSQVFSSSAARFRPPRQRMAPTPALSPPRDLSVRQPCR